ncbi:MAG: hypothetical protein KatS3mg105_2772 [Gemmatales bacterium]|nr:MAG: hypothetical protein KatS3mg105_2772 [Gemmatales bacterium]
MARGRRQEDEGREADTCRVQIFCGAAEELLIKSRFQADGLARTRTTKHAGCSKGWVRAGFFFCAGLRVSSFTMAWRLLLSASTV